MLDKTASYQKENIIFQVFNWVRSKEESLEVEVIVCSNVVYYLKVDKEQIETSTIEKAGNGTLDIFEI